MALEPVYQPIMAQYRFFESRWGRDVGLTIAGWLLALAIAIGLLLTVIRAFFLG